MKIRTIHSDKYTQQDIDDIVELLSTRNTKDINYDIQDWESKPYTLLHVFLNTTRFSSKNGGLLLVYQNEKCCCVSGYNRSEFNSDIFILGARTYIDPKYRHQLLMSSVVIPNQLEKILGVAKMAIFLFDRRNEFNLYDIFVSGKLNLFLKNKYYEFRNIWDNLQAVEHPISIYTGITQNALYIKLDRDFEFDWLTLKATNV
jgi:hypothetical protein